MTGLQELPALKETRFSSVRVLPETGSTNADLLAEAAAGAPEGLVLATDHQTAGRGRQSRAWHDDPGNALLVSLLLRPDRSLAPLLPLLTGVAAVEAVATMTEDDAPGGPAGSPGPVGLKWPNDVLAPALDERKLAGILAESATGDGRSMVVVVGMGLNLRWGTPPPPEVAARAATLTEVLDRPVDRDDVLDRYLRCYELWLGRYERRGPEVLLRRYRELCLTIGRRVRFTTSTAEHVGEAIDVSDRGTLLLDTADRPGAAPVELHAGDAHHLPL